jgi:flagellar protein FlaJ
MVLSVTSIVTQDVGTIINISVIAMFILVTPIFFYKYMEFLWIKAVEREFPNFMRDLANLKRSGMTLSEAVKLTTKTNYGKLTPEIIKLSNRLSWGTPFLRALEIFSKRFKESKMITQAVDIIKESYSGGGNIAAILDSLSRDVIEIKDAEDERMSIARQHVMTMYGIFFMFVAIAIGITYTLVPMMSSGDPDSPLTSMFQDPCSAGGIFPCGLFSVICAGFGASSGVGCYYLSLFFSVLVIQAIFMGLIAGQLGESSIVAGVKHSLIMLAAAFLIFTFLAKTGMLPV